MAQVIDMGTHATMSVPNKEGSKHDESKVKNTQCAKDGCLKRNDTVRCRLLR